MQFCWCLVDFVVRKKLEEKCIFERKFHKNDKHFQVYQEPNVAQNASCLSTILFVNLLNSEDKYGPPLLTTQVQIFIFYFFPII